VLIGKQPFTVIGVMQKKPEFMSSEAPDEYLNWIPVSTYQLLANPRYIDRISITYKNLNLLTGTKQQIQQIIALHHNADPDDSSIVNFTDLAKIQNTINTFFYGMQIFLGIIGSLTLLIAGVGIANVMFASIKRATHEIGVQMALGARTYHILFHYIAESFLVTIIGGSIGLVLSFLLVFGVRKITFQGKLIEVIGQPNPVLSLKVIFIVVVILGLTGFLAGLFPAMKAAKVDPAESLTYE
jgi:putative ABC transport system permease protein